MLEPVWGTPTWRPETSGNIWSLVRLSQTFILTVKVEYIRIGNSLNILGTRNSKT